MTEAEYKSQLTLFEVETKPECANKKMSFYQKFKTENNYRKAIYANKDGKRCVWCKHILQNSGNRNNYYKCELLGLSHGSATDIRLSCVCDLFEEA